MPVHVRYLAAHDAAHVMLGRWSVALVLEESDDAFTQQWTTVFALS